MATKTRKKKATTPDYVLRSVAKYDRRVVKKGVVLNPDVEQDIIDAINNDGEMAFSRLCKHLLRQHYGLY